MVTVFFEIAVTGNWSCFFIVIESVKSILSVFRQREKKGVELSTVFRLVFPTRWYGHVVHRRRGAETLPIVCLSLFPTIFYGCVLENEFACNVLVCGRAIFLVFVLGVHCDGALAVCFLWYACELENEFASDNFSVFGRAL